jgi:hypothetical protein
MSNILTYIPTYISLTLQGGCIAIYDNTKTQQYYQNTDGTIELPYSATGSWSYQIARYGFKLITGTFTIDRTVGGTVTINALPLYATDSYVSDVVNSVSAYNNFSSTQNIYDYLSYYRTTSAGLAYGDQNLYSSILDVGSNNFILNDTLTAPFNYNGSTFILKSSSLSGVLKTTGNVTLSGNSYISNITVTTSRISSIPIDLSNTTINGTLVYNTNTPTSIVYTNCTVSTVVNDGSASVLIKRVNSTINNATDPEILNYAPTIINVSPSGGAVAIYDNGGVRQYYITTTSSIVLPSTASGTWSYRVAKYGYYSSYQTFVVDPSVGGTVNINPTFSPDLFITESSVATVSAYTDLTTIAKIHDYLSYWETTSVGINYGDVESESFGVLNFTKPLTFDANAANIASVSGNDTLVLKVSRLDGAITIVTPGYFYLLNGSVLSNTIKIRSGNLDSELTYVGANSITIFQTQGDRDSNINPGPSSTGDALRFKYGQTLSGVTMSGDRYSRVIVGGVILANTISISQGTNVFDFSTTGQLQILLQNQAIINRGVQKASKLIPHSENVN